MLNFCNDCYYLSKNHNLNVEFNVKPQDTDYNISYFTSMMIIEWMVMEVLIPIAELSMIIDLDSELIQHFFLGFRKSVIITFMGISHLGVCGDFGIASGSLTIIAGILSLIISFFNSINGDFD